MGIEYLRERTACARILTEEEERRIGKSARTAKTEAERTEALNDLVESNIKLVLHIAGKYAQSGVDIDELVGAGTLALVEAAKIYDERKGRFYVFACFSIRHAMRKTLALMMSAVRYPGYVLTDKQSLSNRFRTTLSPERAAVALNRSVSQAKRVLAKFATSVSFDKPLEEGSGSLADILSDENAASPSEVLAEKDLELFMLQAVETLSPSERHVLHMHFGLCGFQPRNLESIGKELNLTRERIRQVRNAAYQKLKKYLRKKAPVANATVCY